MAQNMQMILINPEMIKFEALSISSALFISNEIFFFKHL